MLELLALVCLLKVFGDFAREGLGFDPLRIGGFPGRVFSGRA
jgi:hypothetical protein